jgi:hypothetical protein
MFVPVVRKTFPNKITVFVSRFFLRDIPRRHLLTILRNKVSRSLSTWMQTLDDIKTHVRMYTLASAIPEILRSLQRFKIVSGSSRLPLRSFPVFVELAALAG